MSTALANFLFEAVNVLLLAAALGYFFFKPVRAALDRERDQRAQADAEVARLRAEAEELTGRAKASWAAADAQITEHRERLLSAARAEVARLKEQARSEQTSERQAFDKDLRAAREAQTDELAAAVGEVAAAGVRRLLDSVAGPDLDTALVRAAVEELRRTPSATGGTLVECPRPLGAGARAELAAVLGPDFAERIVPELGAGVRVTTGAGQVDATAAGFARLAAREVARISRGPDGSDGG